MSSLGEIVDVIREIRTELRRQGATQQAIDQATENVVRDRWPFTREWKYLCQQCGDTGWVEGVCTPAQPCGRPFSLPQRAADDYTGRGRCTPEHTYVRPCWCQKGQAFRRALEKTPTGDDFTQAGKTSPPLTRYGR